MRAGVLLVTFICLAIAGPGAFLIYKGVKFAKAQSDGRPRVWRYDPSYQYNVMAIPFGFSLVVLAIATFVTLLT